MIETFLFVALTYAAVIVCVVATVYRFKRARTTISAMSSQFLEARGLRWGSGPWHAGIFVVLALHARFLLVPGPARAIFSVPAVLYTIEIAGVAASLLCAAGLVVLIVRRLTSSRVQAVTSVMDLVVLALVHEDIDLWIALPEALQDLGQQLQ